MLILSDAPLSGAHPQWCSSSVMLTAVMLTSVMLTTVILVLSDAGPQIYSS